MGAFAGDLADVAQWEKFVPEICVDKSIKFQDFLKD